MEMRLFRKKRGTDGGSELLPFDSHGVLWEVEEVVGICLAKKVRDNHEEKRGLTSRRALWC